jgi:hypothetical protein
MCEDLVLLQQDKWQYIYRSHKAECRARLLAALRQYQISSRKTEFIVPNLLREHSKTVHLTNYLHRYVVNLALISEQEREKKWEMGNGD